MRIGRLEIRDWLCLRELVLDLAASVVLICGPNGSGKSSVLDAIRFCLLGEPGRVRLKRDHGSLLPPAAKDGRITMDVNGQTVSRAVRSGEVSPEEYRPHPLIEHVLDAPRLARLDDTDRRRVLLRATGVQITPDTVQEQVAARGLSVERFHLIRPLLRAGWDAAAQECQRKASEARGAWKAITHEVYGSLKAATWRPEPVAHVSKADILAAVEASASAEDAVARAQRELGRVAAQPGTVDAMRRRAGSEAAIRADLHRAEADMQRLSGEVRRLEAEASPPQGIMLPCPACLVQLRYSQGRLEVCERGPAPDGAVEAHRLLPQTRSALGAASDRVRDLRARLEGAEAAREALEHMEQPDVAAAQAEIERLQRERSAAATALLEIQHRAEEAAAAEQAEQRALEQHIEVKAWTELAEALAPAGIPAQMLADALDPLNEHMERLAADTGWPQAHVGDDMGITLGGRAYGLLSESERWRTDAMLASAIADASGLRLLVLDRMDVLDIPGRGEAMRWLVGLGNSGWQVVVAATLKAPPDCLTIGHGVAVVWLGRE